MSNGERPLFKQPFQEWLDLVLRTDDWIKLPNTELALLIRECYDKAESLCHIEFPGENNHNTSPFLWRIKAWKKSEENRIETEERNRVSKLEWDNLKMNLHLIATAYSKLTTQSYPICNEFAQEVLINHNDGYIETMLGIKLVVPYYKGRYVFMPESRK